jgi:diguanylate cyclase (GGDEF)-like protein/PAS domain S-box-containing protein
MKTQKSKSLAADTNLILKGTKRKLTTVDKLLTEPYLLNILLENVPDTIYFKDIESRFIKISRSQAELLGLSDPVDAIGKTDFDFFTEENARLAYEDEQKIIRTGQTLTQEERKTWPNRPDRWVLTTKIPLRDQQGEIIGTFGISRDITDRKQAEAALQKARDELELRVQKRTTELALVNQALQADIARRQQVEEALAKEQYLHNYLLDNIPDCIYFKDTKSRFIKTSKTLAKALGVSDPAQLVGKSDFDFYPEEYARLFYEDEQSIIQTGNSISKEEVEIWPDLPPGWAFTTKMPLRNQQGEIIGTFGISEDISARKLAEAAQEQNKHLFRALFELSPDSIVLIDPHDPNVSWPIFDCNVAACTMNGYLREELIGHSIDILNVTIGSQAERSAYMKQLREIGSHKYETQHRRKNGDIYPVEVSTSIIQIGERELVIGIDRDITERKRDQEEIQKQSLSLRQSEERFHLVSYATNDVVWDWDLLTGKIWRNQSMERFFGFRADQIGSDNEWWHAQIHPDDRPKVIKSIHTAIDSGEDFWSKEYRYQRADGSFIYVFDRGYIIHNEDGKPIRMIGAMMDITARKQAEEVLRMEAVHDPLTGLFNRRYMEEMLDREILRLVRNQQQSISIIMLDIDHFKQVNDTLGHAIGDALLRQLGSFLLKHVRGSDIACRYGGDEFVLILPNAPLEIGQQRAEKICADIKNLIVEPYGKLPGNLTLSLGVALFPDHGATREAVFLAADDALYLAKEAGRNRVVVAKRAGD